MEYTVTKIKGKGYTATVYRPILSDEEKIKRDKEIVETLKSIYKGVARREALAKELLHEQSK